MASLIREAKLANCMDGIKYDYWIGREWLRDKFAENEMHEVARRLGRKSTFSAWVYASHGNMSWAQEIESNNMALGIHIDHSAEQTAGLVNLTYKIPENVLVVRRHTNDEPEIDRRYSDMGQRFPAACEWSGLCDLLNSFDLAAWPIDLRREWFQSK